MGVGCDDYGLCYAEAHGQPEQCPRYEDRRSKMKHKHLYSLLDESFVLVKVTFTERNPIREHHKPRTYDYKVPRNWNVKEDDMIVVDTPTNGFVVVAVVSVDEHAIIDPDADHDYKWAVQKIDTTEHDMLVAREREFAEKMLHVERMSQREEALRKYKESLGIDSTAMQVFNDAVSKLSPPSPPENDGYRDHPHRPPETSDDAVPNEPEDTPDVSTS